MDRFFERVAQSVASWAGRPPAFILAATIIVIWGITARCSIIPIPGSW